MVEPESLRVSLKGERNRTHPNATERKQTQPNANERTRTQTNAGECKEV